MRRILALALVAAASCGGPAPAGEGTTPSPREPATVPDTEAAPPAPGDAPLSAAECERMSDHMVNVRVDEMRGADPDSVPTPEQQTAIRDELRLEFTKTCLNEGVPREVFECWLKATTSAALAVCAGSSDGEAAPTDVGSRSP